MKKLTLKENQLRKKKDNALSSVFFICFENSNQFAAAKKISHTLDSCSRIALSVACSIAVCSTPLHLCNIDSRTYALHKKK